LQTHKNGPTSLIKALDQEGITGTHTTVFMYDNNVPQGHDSILFGVINAQSKEIVINDVEKMKVWLRKSNLSVKIELPTVYEYNTEYSVELYTGTELTIEEYFEPLNKRGYDLKMSSLSFDCKL